MELLLRGDHKIFVGLPGYGSQQTGRLKMAKRNSYFFFVMGVVLIACIKTMITASTSGQVEFIVGKPSKIVRGFEAKFGDEERVGPTPLITLIIAPKGRPRSIALQPSYKVLDNDWMGEYSITFVSDPDTNLVLLKKDETFEAPFVKIFKLKPNDRKDRRILKFAVVGANASLTPEKLHELLNKLYPKVSIIITRGLDRSVEAVTKWGLETKDHLCILQKHKRGCTDTRKAYFKCANDKLAILMDKSAKESSRKDKSLETKGIPNKRTEEEPIDFLITPNSGYLGKEAIELEPPIQSGVEEGSRNPKNFNEIVERPKTSVDLYKPFMGLSIEILEGSVTVNTKAHSGIGEVFLPNYEDGLTENVVKLAITNDEWTAQNFVELNNAIPLSNGTYTRFMLWNLRKIKLDPKAITRILGAASPSIAVFTNVHVDDYFEYAEYYERIKCPCLEGLSALSEGKLYPDHLFDIVIFKRTDLGKIKNLKKEVMVDGSYLVSFGLEGLDITVVVVVMNFLEKLNYQKDKTGNGNVVEMALGSFFEGLIKDHFGQNVLLALSHFDASASALLKDIGNHDSNQYYGNLFEGHPPLHNALVRRRIGMDLEVQSADQLSAQEDIEIIGSYLYFDHEVTYLPIIADLGKKVNKEEINDFE